MLVDGADVISAMCFRQQPQRSVSEEREGEMWKFGQERRSEYGLTKVFRFALDIHLGTRGLRLLDIPICIYRSNHTKCAN